MPQLSNRVCPEWLFLCKVIELTFPAYNECVPSATPRPPVQTAIPYVPSLGLIVNTDYELAISASAEIGERILDVKLPSHFLSLFQLLFQPLRVMWWNRMLRCR